MTNFPVGTIYNYPPSPLIWVTLPNGKTRELRYPNECIEEDANPNLAKILGRLPPHLVHTATEKTFNLNPARYALPNNDPHADVSWTPTGWAPNEEFLIEEAKGGEVYETTSGDILVATGPGTARHLKLPDDHIGNLFGPRKLLGRLPPHLIHTARSWPLPAESSTSVFKPFGSHTELEDSQAPGRRAEQKLIVCHQKLQDWLSKNTWGQHEGKDPVDAMIEEANELNKEAKDWSHKYFFEIRKDPKPVKKPLKFTAAVVLYALLTPPAAFLWEKVTTTLTTPPQPTQLHLGDWTRVTTCTSCNFLLPNLTPDIDLCPKCGGESFVIRKAQGLWYDTWFVRDRDFPVGYMFEDGSHTPLPAGNWSFPNKETP